MIRRFTLMLLHAHAAIAMAQKGAPLIHGQSGGVPDLSPETLARFAWYSSVLNSSSELDPADSAKFWAMYFDIGETRESPCQVIGMECSWYCGGGPDSIWASSVRMPTAERSFDAWHVHNLDYCTAWSEGAPGPGIGESLSYRFANDSPRLHTVMVSNGMVTSESDWRACNRVKRLRIDENGKAVAILALEDTMADQAFKLPRLFGRRADGRPMVLTFTILEVYPGEQHDDTVITEIWFDGTDVH